MPYIPQSRRARAETHPMTAGELNFAITKLLLNYERSHGLSYLTFSDISSACTEALAEYRRRRMADYEEAKREEHGDVYGES